MEIAKEEFYNYLTSLIGTKVNDDTLFFDGIGMTGLDAWTFIETVAQKYNVDFSHYNWQEYHDSDADLGNFLKGLKYIFKKRILFLQFSGLHLYKVAQMGKWISPVGRSVHKK